MLTLLREYARLVNQKYTNNDFMNFVDILKDDKYKKFILAPKLSDIPTTPKSDWVVVLSSPVLLRGLIKFSSTIVGLDSYYKVCLFIEN